jgi:biotin synthase-like enzyme
VLFRQSLRDRLRVILPPDDIILSATARSLSDTLPASCAIAGATGITIGIKSTHQLLDNSHSSV